MKKVLIISSSLRKGSNSEQLAVSFADGAKSAENEVEVMGPAKAGIGRINDIYRFIFYIKSNDKNILIRCKNRLEEGLSLSSRLQVYFDFNPLNPL